MADDDTTTGSDGANDQSSEEAGGNAADPQKVIDDLRKRQSGADKAREAEVAERDALQARLDALLSGKGKGEAENQPVDADAIRAQVQKEYEAKLAAVTLDAKYPEARKRFPEVTDTVKLAELESIFSDTPAAPPKPIGNNPASGGTGAKRIEDMSVKELRAAADAEAAKLLNPKS